MKQTKYVYPPAQFAVFIFLQMSLSFGQWLSGLLGILIALLGGDCCTMLSNIRQVSTLHSVSPSGQLCCCSCSGVQWESCFLRIQGKDCCVFSLCGRDGLEEDRDKNNFCPYVLDVPGGARGRGYDAYDSLFEVIFPLRMRLFHGVPYLHPMWLAGSPVCRPSHSLVRHFSRELDCWWNSWDSNPKLWQQILVLPDGDLTCCTTRLVQ